MIINKYNKYQNLYRKDLKTKKSFDKLYKKSLEENLINGNDYKPLFNIFTKFMDETKNKAFLKKLNVKLKLKLFNTNKVKFNREHKT